MNTFGADTDGDVTDWGEENLEEKRRSAYEDDWAVAKIIGRARAMRQASGLSLQKAANLIGCTKPHLWDLEQGRAANPSIRILLGMARAYRVRLVDLCNPE